MLNKKSIGLVALINGGSAVLGLLYSVVLARYFGVGSDIEIYFASTTLLFLINSLSQSGQLAEIALPVYHRFQNSDGQEAANHALSVVVNWMILIALFISIGAFLAARTLFTWSASGFEPQQIEDGIFLFRLICPLIFVEILKAQITSIVNAEKKFGKIELINIINQLVSIGFVVFLSGKIQIYSVVLGFWVGEVLSIAYGIYLVQQSRFRYHFVFRYRGFTISDLFRNLGYTFSYVIVAQIYLFYFNNLLTHLPKGQYAVFKYAQLIFTKLQGLLIRPISTIFFSQFSSAYHAGSTAIRALVKETSSLSFVLSSVVFAWIVALGRPLLKLMWEGEKFDSYHIGLIYTSLALLTLNIFFNSYALIFRKISMTLGKVRDQYLGYIVVQLITMGLLFVFEERMSLETIILISLANALMLCAVPLLISVAYGSSDIPVSLGNRQMANLLFFIGLSFAGYGAAELSFAAGLAGQAFQVCCSGIWMLTVSIGLIFLLKLDETRIVQSILNRLKIKR